MESGLIVTMQQLKKLDENNIDYTYWDSDCFDNKFEIELDNENDLKKAKAILQIN